MLTNAELERLSRLARARGIPLIIDNAYGMPFPNIVFTDADPLWDENTIVCMSLSKLGLPGVRTGIVIAREEIIEMVARVNAVMSLAPGGVGPALLTDMIRSGEIIDLSRDVVRPFYERKMQEVVAADPRELPGESITASTSRKGRSSCGCGSRTCRSRASSSTSGSSSETSSSSRATTSSPA